MNEDLIKELKLTDEEILRERGKRGYYANSVKDVDKLDRAISEAQIRSILDNPKKLNAFLSSEQAKKLGWVKKIGEIREIPNGTASPDAYTADGVGVSWERDAPVFRKFKEANYVRVVSNH